MCPIYKVAIILTTDAGTTGLLDGGWEMDATAGSLTYSRPYTRILWGLL